MSKCHVGDWVCFYHDNRLVIAEVRYVQEDVLGEMVLQTTQGEVSNDDVIECRVPNNGRGPAKRAVRDE